MSDVNTLCDRFIKKTSLYLKDRNASHYQYISTLQTNLCDYRNTHGRHTLTNESLHYLQATLMKSLRIIIAQKHSLLKRAGKFATAMNPFSSVTSYQADSPAEVLICDCLSLSGGYAYRDSLKNLTSAEAFVIPAGIASKARPEPDGPNNYFSFRT